MREKRGLRVFENSMLIIFGTVMDEVTGEWTKLHNEEHNVPNSPPNMVVVIKFQIIKFLGHIASICEQKCLQPFGG